MAIYAVSGPRPPQLGGYRTPNPTYNAVIEQIDRKFLELGPDSIITGLDLGFDQWAAEVALRNDIPFIAALPCEGYESQWPEESKVNFRRLLDKARQVVYTNRGDFSQSKVNFRNRWMVNGSNGLIALCVDELSNTGEAVKYAENVSKQVYHIVLPEPYNTQVRRTAEGMHARAAMMGRMFRDTGHAVEIGRCPPGTFREPGTESPTPVSIMAGSMIQRVGAFPGRAAASSVRVAPRLTPEEVAQARRRFARAQQALDDERVQMRREALLSRTADLERREAERRRHERERVEAEVREEERRREAGPDRLVYRRRLDLGDD